MRISYKLDAKQSRFCVGIEPEDFDARPGLGGIWFDGINEPINPDAAALAAWILVAPYVSQKIRFPNRISRLLLNSMAATWPGNIDIGEAHDEDDRFPARVGSLYIKVSAMHAINGSKESTGQPVYELEMLPLNANGSSYAGKSIKVKTNAGLLGNGLTDNVFPGLLASAVLYADFFGILHIIMPEALMVAAPRCGKGDGQDSVLAWGELLKAAGFILKSYQ